jgi:hypothetical protein
MTAPTLNGQVIGQAHFATRALLDRVLAQTGTTFEESVALNLVANHGDLTLTTAKVLADLRTQGLLSDDELTDEGRARFAHISAGIADIAARLYGDLPADDLAIAGRVLATVTARARAELA